MNTYSIRAVDARGHWGQWLEHTGTLPEAQRIGSTHAEATAHGEPVLICIYCGDAWVATKRKGQPWVIKGLPG